MIIRIFIYPLLLLSLPIKLYSQSDRDTSNASAKGREIATQLQNPVANLISIPFQNNFEFKAGPQNGFKYTLNFQPVIPFSLGKKWNLITRTIVPVVSQMQVVPSSEVTSSETGLSDILFSAFLSPKNSKLILGIGPALSFPTASNSLLGSKKWAAGPTAIVAKQSGPWTLGVLVNHLWSYAGDEARGDISSTYYQPFVSYVNKTHTTFALSSESTHDMKNDRWTTSIVPAISQLTKLAALPANLQLGAKYYFSNPGFTPKWGIRASVILVIPG